MVIKKQIVSLPVRPRRNSSKQANNAAHRKVYDAKPRIESAKCRLLLLIVLLITTAWGIGSLIFTPLQMLLRIRLEMSPGLPPYDWWVQPPDEVLLKVHLFNITNSERFLNGSDEKIAVQEIGPIVYREKLRHFNVKSNANSTLSYRANRTAIFLPEMNTINLTDFIVVPNLAVLLIPAYFHDASMFVKWGVNVLLKSFNGQPLVRMSIQDYLWNATDPILDAAEKLAPTLVPMKNVGLLSTIYQDFENDVTVFTGPKHGNAKFFTIDKYDGSGYLPHYASPACQQRFRNASEGIGYPQMLTKDTNLTYWRRSICKLADIRFTREDSKYGIQGYRFQLVPWAYSRTQWEGNPDCFAGTPALPNGVADISSCYWGFPMAVSFPHFLFADASASAAIEGLSPNEEDHGSFVLIEPVTGVPLEGKARSQINLVMKPLTGFPDNIQRFSNSVLPLAWMEYHQVGVPTYIQLLVYLAAVVVPSTQLAISLISLSLGILCGYFLINGLFPRSPFTAQGLKREDQALI
ncbi:scavenger receptor class B member 1 isoform X1 [Dendroctonus ponderosae]|uniref:Scavenger receptor class B member 1 n=1 Tax=Dendroctonus ponderosae TaxID=77166 RepID=J3JYX0_DENPD|nr:scavenger receptor class B member 1 isoform X1 [Dendroctonus ponderosae]XP_019768071.2 scavenger receptor class B member 1 isoform X1 [Dendroctonus ponderosae]AEE63408.1 unknown [Dendroctonus ponderosae]ERL95040.1 hypothetical protein D910_12310 [Dendroctonus ponderosae]